MPGKRRFWLAVAVQVLVLLALVAVHGYTLTTGRPVTLKTVPVDPWSYTSGRYVALRYEISHMEEGQIPMDGAPYHRNQIVWVTLQEGEPYWAATAISAEQPKVQPDQVAVRARVDGAWQEFRDGGSGRGPWEYNLRYGIEQFYIPESEKDLERRGADFTVEALVDSFGRPALHRVFMDGKEVRWQ